MLFFDYYTSLATVLLVPLRVIGELSPSPRAVS